METGVPRRQRRRVGAHDTAMTMTRTPEAGTTYRSLIAASAGRHSILILVAVLAFFPLLSSALVIWTHRLSPPMDDFTAYWIAGQHIRTGGMLYGPVPTPPEPVVYRYAPWFAWLWAPLTVFPEAYVRVGWYLILMAASVSVLLPLLKYRLAGWCAAAVLSVFFVDGAATGNVSPLMAAALFWALPNRSGPFAIAATASLKGISILLIIVYLGRRDWRSAAIAVLSTAVLVAPTLLYDLSNFVFEPLPTPYGLGTMPVIWVGVSLLAVLVTLKFANTRFGWLAGSLASLAAAPHLFLHYLALIAPGVASGPTTVTSRESRKPNASSPHES